MSDDWRVCAVDVQRDRRRWTGGRRRRRGAAAPIGADCVEGLAELPGPALVARFELQVAARHVEARPRSRRRGPAHRRSAMSRPPLPIATTSSISWWKFACLRRIGDARRPAGVDDGVGRLHEEERRLAVRVLAHLAGVGGVVAADAEDAVDGELFVAPATVRVCSGGASMASFMGVVPGQSDQRRCSRMGIKGAAAYGHQRRCSRHRPSACCTGRSEKLNSTASRSARSCSACHDGTTKTSRGPKRAGCFADLAAPPPSRHT